MKIDIGGFSVEFRKPTAFEAVGFVPLFSRYLDTINEASKLYEQQIKDAKTEEDKKKIEENYKLNRERMLASYFGTFDEFTRKELIKYIAKLIVDWDYKEKPTPELLEQLPPLILLALFDNVAVLTLFGDESSINFFVDMLNSQSKKEEKD